MTWYSFCGHTLNCCSNLVRILGEHPSQVFFLSYQLPSNQHQCFWEGICSDSMFVWASGPLKGIWMQPLTSCWVHVLEICLSLVSESGVKTPTSRDGRDSVSRLPLPLVSLILNQRQIFHRTGKPPCCFQEMVLSEGSLISAGSGRVSLHVIVWRFLLLPPVVFRALWLVPWRWMMRSTYTTYRWGNDQI